MPFNLQRFKTTEFQRRTEDVPVPGLASFFDEDDPAVLTVQNLVGEEIARARLRVSQNSAIDELVSRLVSERAASKIDGIQQALGLGDDVPDDLVYRIAVAEFGICSADFQQEDCVKMAAVAPEDFYALTQKIFALTGLGQVPLGESNASGTTSASGTP